ncbi:monovalent cation:proton antiporter family protein [Candidatus Leptofilum sp.]|uniref:monovalent cation:proton antiporter family protein n=1 Tax=Candidatus Leptofilum sp. TaxID=3241576 RepID=UPI003B5C53E4
MEFLQELPLFLLNFSVIALASWQIGRLFAHFNLPKISGYLFTGLIAGPFVLGFASNEVVESLRFIDEVSLAFIAFAAGSELYLPEIRGRLRSIGLVTAFIVFITVVGGTLAVFLLADFIPFMDEFSVSSQVAIALMAATIMVARSPSVAIALINELRARGPFTQMALGVTVISDVLVIVFFAISADIADAILTGVSINLGLLLLLAVELLLSVGLGLVLSRMLLWVLNRHWQLTVKTAVILTFGYSVYLLSGFIREYTHDNFPVEILLEPLLICMVASFVINNFSSCRLEFSEILHDVGPFIYVAFFTLVGEGLKLEILAQVWPIALALALIRIVVILIGSFGGGLLAGDSMKSNQYKWMVFVTQAGVALGLAKEVAVEFPGWGDAFATTIIAMVVLNEIVGPILFKFALNKMGETHVQAEPAPFDGVRDAIILGFTPQSITLARQLKAHHWQVRLAAPENEKTKAELARLNNGMEVHLYDELSVDVLQSLEAPQADSFVLMLPNEQNLSACELIFEHFGTETVVVHSTDRELRPAFQELGALIVEPDTAVVSLLEQFVRAPSASSLLLGTEHQQEIVDIELRNRDLDGITLRELRLPLDVLILSVRRGQQTLVSHGHTQLKLGDKVTLYGVPERLDEVMLRFDAQSAPVAR